MNGAPSLVLNNTDLVNNGSFIPGNSRLSFTDDVVSGSLQLNDHVLDLGYSGSIIGERNGSCITGIDGGLVKRSAELNSPQGVNPGNIGVAISSPVNLGWVAITRGHVEQTNSDGQSGIRRYFDIVPSLNTGLQASLRFYYLEGELAGKSKAELALFSTPVNQQDWLSVGRDGSNTDSNWVMKNNIDRLQRFTLAVGAEHSDDQASVGVYPNPSHDVFMLKLMCGKEKDALIGLYDATGHLLEVKSVHCIAGTTLVEWGIKQYAAGAYYLLAKGMNAKGLEVIKQ